jgi:hypothetical protein
VVGSYLSTRLQFEMDSLSSVDGSIGRAVNLTVKAHAFTGAVLTPKHARELTPSLCLAITSALAEQAYRKDAIPYTSWITEAWRVLGCKFFSAFGAWTRLVLVWNNMDTREKLGKNKV